VLSNIGAPSRSLTFFVPGLVCLFQSISLPILLSAPSILDDLIARLWRGANRLKNLGFRQITNNFQKKIYGC